MRRALRALVSLGCLVYALQGIDFGRLRGALLSYSLLSVLAVAVLFVLCAWIQAVRLSVLFEPRLRIAGAFNAVIVGLGLNNVLPAKGGEAAKAVYICKSLGRPASSAAGAVVFERFLDVNCLYALAALALGGVVRSRFLVPAGVFFAACWALFIFCRSRPDVFDKAWGAVPILNRIKFLEDLKILLLRGLTWRQIALSSCAALCSWAVYGMYSVCAFLWVGGFRLSLTEAFSAFLISAAGLLAPSSPGSIGVFEASVVWGLGLFGVDRESSLGIAFLLRMVQFLPTLAAAVIVLRK
jgi:uncharacterized membrane protein YbhN (UPF0104 family)